jgi:uncharacterized protein with PQ loop repeat
MESGGNIVMIELIGWIGSIALSLCGAPQAYKSFMDKSSVGISNSFLNLWLGGEIFQLIYVFEKRDVPLIFSCLMNTLFIIVIYYYKILPKKEDVG